jgi:hypothetical protein
MGDVWWVGTTCSGTWSGSELAYEAEQIAREIRSIVGQV